MVGQPLVRLTFGPDHRRIVESEAMFRGQGRVRDVEQSPDGFIYLAIDGERGARTAVLRLEPVARP